MILKRVLVLVKLPKIITAVHHRIQVIVHHRIQVIVHHRILVIIHLLQVLNLQAQVQELLPRIRTIFGNLLIKHSSLLWAVQKVIQSSLRRVREWRLFVQMLRPYHQLKII